MVTAERAALTGIRAPATREPEKRFRCELAAGARTVPANDEAATADIGGVV
jgi:hypothetical protein